MVGSHILRKISELRSQRPQRWAPTEPPALPLPTPLPSERPRPVRSDRDEPLPRLPRIIKIDLG